MVVGVKADENVHFANTDQLTEEIIRQDVIFGHPFAPGRLAERLPRLRPPGARKDYSDGSIFVANQIRRKRNQ
jgi:hypothetical protein